MSYTSFAYLVMIFFAFLLYYIFPKKARWIVLLGANLFFYVWAGWDKFIFMFVSVVISYLAARAMAKLFDKLNQDMAAEGLDKKQIRAMKAATEKISDRRPGGCSWHPHCREIYEFPFGKCFWSDPTFSPRAGNLAGEDDRASWCFLLYLPNGGLSGGCL